MLKRILKYLMKFLLWFFVCTLLWVVIYKWAPVPFTPLMAIRWLESGGKESIKHDWESLDVISKDLQLAVICAEDQNFLKHRGFDFKAIEKAYDSNKKGKKVRGASTITQQTAKNVFLWPQRSWLRKGLEVYFTFWIETFWSKERIMEVYLNSIEMGKGVYGAEAASQYWFKKSAKRLSKYEAASIAVILPNPRKYIANGSSSYMGKRRQWVMRQMRFHGPFTLNKLIE